jgi:CHAD domain-containing protein
MATSAARKARRKQEPAPVRPVDLGLSEQALGASAGDPPAAHVRAKLDEQLRALLEHDPIARVGTDPEGVHQMRVAVRRMRAALKADGSTVEGADHLQGELKWLGGSLGAVRDLDVQLEHLHAQTTDFDPAERIAVTTLLAGLVADRRRARQQMIRTLGTHRYTRLLEALAAAVRSTPAGDGEPGVATRKTSKPWAAHLVELIERPYRKLVKAANALPADPPDDALHALRIRGKRLRYAAELAVPAGGKPVKKLINATKEFQDLLGDHQDAVVAEHEIRRLLAALDTPTPDVGFVAGRLVERERARRLTIRATWRAALAEVDAHATTVLAGRPDARGHRPRRAG